MYLKRLAKLLINIHFLQKIIAYGLLILFFYFFSDFLGLFFLTFVFGYLFLSLGTFLKEKFDVLILNMKLKDQTVHKLRNIVTVNKIIVLLYILFIFILTFTISDIIPNITTEIGNSSKYITDINHTIQGILTDIDNNFGIKAKYNIDLNTEFSNLFNHNSIDISSRFSSIASKLKVAGVFVFQILLALILSFIFIMDRVKMSKYLDGIKNSNFSFFYREYKIIFEKITKSFGLIFKAQSMIAFVNAVLTGIGLFIIGLFFKGGFPLIYTLAIIVFIAGFIPVFGTFISSVPILIIAFSIGGFSAAMSVVVLVLIVHSIEAYYLNPKIVSSFMELPMSLTFIVLIVSEHYFGIVGLIIGVSMFYFIVDLLKDLNNIISKGNEVLKSQDEILSKTKTELNNSIRVSRKIKESM